MANVVSETLAVTGCLEARQVRSVGNVVSGTLAMSMTDCQEARQVKNVGNVVLGTLGMSVVGWNTGHNRSAGSHTGETGKAVSATVDYHACSQLHEECNHPTTNCTCIDL